MIVGGGYTGLSTAVHLGERGIRPLVLEARDIGWGESSRSFGQVVPYLWDAWIEELLHVPRRREARVPVSIAVWSHTAPGSDPGRGLSLNISVKGMLLETKEPLDIGSKIDLTFTLPGSAGPVRAVGQVVREDPARDGGPPRLGIEFLILRDGARDRIRSYVESGEGK